MPDSKWLLFVSQLPASPSSLRVMVWRRMRASGALGLQNGVWVLPHRQEHERFLQQLLQSFEGWWESLAQWDRLEPEQVRALTALIEKSYGQRLDALGEARDRRLAAILQALEQARRG